MADKKTENSGPLVSVCIITYNSSRYILEALDSVYNQTYQNIELIVSDDGSKDDTVKITEKWLQKNKDRFVDTKLITVDKNTGTTKNSNRGLKAAKGEWFRYFAGDDVLFPDAIEKYVNFVKDKPNVKWVFAKAIRYRETISDECIMSEGWDYELIKKILNKDRLYQFRRIVIQNFLWYPTHFFYREMLNIVGGFDEAFGIYEDYPMWLKLYNCGEQCYFLDEFVFGYRLSESSVVNNESYMLNRNIRKLAFIARKKYILGKLSWVEALYSYLAYINDMFFTIKILNKRTKFRLLFRKICCALIAKPCKFLQSVIRIK